MNFEERIKALKAEVEALKTVRRKSSTTFATITKPATCTAQLYKTSAGVVVCQYAGLVKISPSTSGEQPIIGYSQVPYSSRNRDITLTPWVDGSGTLGILCIPDASGLDSGMATETTKNVTVTIYITSTVDFTTSTAQVRNY